MCPMNTSFSCAFNNDSDGFSEPAYMRNPPGQILAAVQPANIGLRHDQDLAYEGVNHE